MFRHSILLVLSGLMFSLTTASGATIYVPDDYNSIDEAIDAAVNGDIVIVRPGTYTENIDFDGKAITVQSEDPFDQGIREGTVIDGSRLGSVVTFANGEGRDSILTGFTIQNGSGTYVSTGGTPPDPPKLNGYAGGGIFCDRTEPTISYNIIGNLDPLDTNVADFGGGIYCESEGQDQEEPEIADNTIHYNLAENYNVDYVGGGGIYSWHCSPWIHHNVIQGNRAHREQRPEGGIWGHGGGVYCADSSSATVEYNNIHGNFSDIGGGLCDRDGCSSIFRKNLIQGNTAHADGGGISINMECTTHVVANVIYVNHANPDQFGAPTRGGGIRIGRAWDQEDAVMVKNNLIFANKATMGGGVFTQNTGSNIIFRSNTITDNIAGNKDTPQGGGGGFFFTKESYVFMDDSIIFGNQTYVGNQTEDTFDSEGRIAVGEQGLTPSSLEIKYSDLALSEVIKTYGCTITTGDGMIDVDPDFVAKDDPAPWEVKFLDHTYPRSLCIDAVDDGSQMIWGSTNIGGTQDMDELDMGYHYPRIAYPVIP